LKYLGIDEVWVIDFEFHQPDGERPEPICMVAREMVSGKIVRLNADDLKARRAAPFPTDRRCVVVAYYAVAEMACFLALGWPLPAYVLDLYTEFRSITNGRHLRAGRSLLGALVEFGLSGVTVPLKEEMRNLAMRGGRSRRGRRRIYSTTARPMSSLLQSC
jgi:DNA polymerase I